MRQLILFILGGILGAMLMLVLTRSVGSSDANKQKQGIISSLLEVIDFRNDSVELTRTATQSVDRTRTDVQYVEVRGRKGVSVLLYTTMPKDSVQALLGKPDEINMNTYSKDVHEDWGYKIKKSHFSDLKINFVNGLLKGVSQN